MVADIKTPDAAALALTQAGHGLDLSTLAAQINEGYGKNTKPNFLKGNLANDAKKRFVDLGDNVWDLKDRAK